MRSRCGGERGGNWEMVWGGDKMRWEMRDGRDRDRQRVARRDGHREW